jgi:hypothetical protein
VIQQVWKPALLLRAKTVANTAAKGKTNFPLASRASVSSLSPLDMSHHQAVQTDLPADEKCQRMQQTEITSAGTFHPLAQIEPSICD